MKRYPDNYPLKQLSRMLPLAAVLFSTTLSLQAQQGAAAVTANVDDLWPSLQRRLPEPQATGPVTSAPEDFSKVQLVPGTLLSMDVFGIPEFSGISLRLDASGDVFIPMLGNVRVSGATVPEAQEIIRKALVVGEILVAPVVRLNITQFAPEYVSVLGEVQNPGRFQVVAKRNLADVLALAGGETLTAGDDIEIQHRSPNGSTEPKHVAYTQRDPLAKLGEITVSPGDSVFVHRTGVVYVLGAVGRPGGYLMVNAGRLNVYQAISLAGGTAADAAKNGMYIIRPHDETFETIEVPFGRLVHQQQSAIQLQRNDVLFVPKSGWKVTLLDGSTIIGSALSGAIYTAH